MESKARQLCAQHGYPEPLCELLEALVALARTHLGDVHSIVLSPSVSTGDFLWKRVGSEVRLLSDIDGFIYLTASAHDLAGYQVAVKRLARDLGGPVFDVDLSVNSIRELDRLPETYQFVETGLAGFVLYGVPVLDRFPSRLDPRVSRQAFLLNLFKPLRYSFVRPDPEGAAQAAARLLLDIPILAASERGECIPGHRARARWFLDHRPKPLGGDDEVCAAVAAAYAAREEPPGSVAILEPLLHVAIPRVVSLLDERGEPASNPDRAAVARLASWLPKRAPRRILGELRSLLHRPTNPAADLRWLLQRKEALAGAALLGLYRYLAEGAVGPAPEGVRACLQTFSRRECTHEDGLAFVRSACTVYCEGLLELYPATSARDS